MTNNPVGSVWRKWDLHFHTPSSYDYSNGSVTNADIVDGLLNIGVKVVAITDHHYIDVGRMTELKDIADGRLTILPGIELRSELGDKPIHYIGIFPESNDLSHIWDTIRGALGLTEEGIRAKGGDDRVYVPIKEAHKIFSELGGLITIHAGAKSNSIEGIENKEQFQQRIKYDIAKNYIDIFEIGQLKDVARYIKIVFPATSLERPLIIGSDNHDIHNYTTPSSCWLKADPTFIGLRQVLNEPVDRVFLGDRPAIFHHIESNKTRYIHSLSFSKRTESTPEQAWFSDVSIEFNTGLVAIIGNKGNGKSALADVLGLLGNCPHEESFSFLQEDQFRHPKDNKAENFDATLTWHSGTTTRKNLNDRYDPSSIESIQYIPQFHLDAICDELKGGKEGRFNEELKQVIFSRVPNEGRLGKETLDKLIEFRTIESQDRVRTILEELRKAATEVVSLEEQSTEAYVNNLKAELEAIEEEIKAHQTTKPTEVQRPDADPERRKEIGETNSRIEALSARVKKLDEEIERKSKELKDVVFKLECISKLRRKLENFKEQFETLISDISSDCDLLGLSANETIKLSIDLAEIDELEDSLKSSETELIQAFDEDNDEGLVKKKKLINEEILELRENLDRPNKDYQSFLETKANWEKKEKSLIGDGETLGTLEYYKQKLDELNEVPEKLETAREKLIEYARQIFREKENQLRVYEELYAPVQQFIDNHPIARERFGLEFHVSLVPSNFVTRFLEFINQGRKGSFYGEDEGRKTALTIVNSANFDTEEGVAEFLSEVVNSLHYDRRDNEKQPVAVKDQLRQAYSPTQLYEYLYSLEYLEPRYVLKWEGKPLEKLSPGERGTLLLIFYLLIDNSRIPLVIDQPEGNLDNQTVYELLVDCVKEAKKKRQIFVVTHNPNLAVVCDAEQVIHASLDKEHDSQLVYSSGALEDPDICQKIIDVLEGTKPAIDNRVAKYKIIFENS